MMKFQDLMKIRRNDIIFYLHRKQMSRTPRVVEITEEEEIPVEAHVVEITPTQLCLKKLTKQKTKYNRQYNSSQSDEERETYKQLIAGIDKERFIIKLSNTNKNIINKVLAYIEYPKTIQDIQAEAIEKIENDEN